MKGQRLLDVVFAGGGLLVLSPLLVILYVIGLWDTGSPLFRQTRVGQHQRPFTLVKFRTMQLETASVATHLVDADSITGFGQFLRRTKLDELPQLWNVFMGDMSLVGPRPCLYNQTELVAARAALGVFSVRPGITGPAQIRGIDMSTPEQLAQVDAQMLQGFGLKDYFSLILLTLSGRGAGDRVRRS